MAGETQKRRGTALSTPWAFSSAYDKKNDEGRVQTAGGRDDGHRPDALRRGQKWNRVEQEVCVRVATWNIGSMSRRSGEVIEALHRRRVDVCCVQEARWKGGSARMLGATGRRYKFFWQGCNEGTAGVGVLVAEKWIGQVLSVNRVNERMLVVRMIMGKRLANIISAYAPQAGRSADDKDQFWDKIIVVMSGIPQDEAIILGGDLNGHVGRDPGGFDGVHGGQGYGVRNVEGERILEFGDALELVVCNTFFKKDKAKLITYNSGGCKSTIDYIMVRKQDRIMVRNVKAIPGEECVSQHRPVIGDLMLRVKNAGAKKHLPRLKVWKLQRAETQKEFREKAEQRAEEVMELMQTGNVDVKWQVMKKSLLEVTEEVCGWSRGEPRQRETWWWNDSVERAVNEKRRCHRVWKKTGDEADRARYVEAKRASRRAVWEAQVAKRNEFASELESERGQKNFFRIAKQMMRERRDVTEASCVKDEGGNIVTDSRGVKEVWRKYMDRLLNVENNWDGDVGSDKVEGECCPIMAAEVLRALKAMKEGKAAGPSGVVTEMLKAAGDVGVQWMTDLCNSVMTEGHIPDDWTKSTLVPLYKGKGDPLACGSYRAIKLLEHGMKVLERVLEKRVRAQVEVDEMQFGFMPGKGTTDAIFITRQMQEKHQEKRRKLYFAFVDLEKAFDRVPREVVRYALRKSGVEESLVKAVMSLYTRACTVVRTAKGDSDGFEVKVGVHQGSVLSPLLFAIVMDVVSRDVRCGLPWELLYADDLVLMAHTREDLARKLAAWKTCLEVKGMKVNAGKSKVMVGGAGLGVIPREGAWPCGVCGKGVQANSLQCTACERWVHRRCSGVKGRLEAASVTFQCKRCRGDVPQADPSDQEGLVVEGETYEVVTSFCYLGDMLNADGGVDLAVNARVRSGWRKFRELMPFLTSKAPPLKMKGQVYSACVRSCMIYGSQTWALKAEHEDKLNRAEMRMIRWMCGVSLKDRKTSAELRQRMGVEAIGEVVRRGRLRWYGHVIRKEENDWVKKVLSYNLEGTRPSGRPKKTWQMTVLEDMKALGIDHEVAMDRSRWKRAISRVKSNPAVPGKRTLNH